MHEMVIYGVSFDLVGKQPIVLLKTTEGNKFLPIWIGHPEAAAILMKLQGATTPRPMTHDLVTDILAQLDAHVVRITVTELRESTFYAQITVQQDGSEVEIDSRPSDAIALVAPVAEELTFRGVGFGLIAPYGRALAIVAVGLAFGLAHGLVEALPILVFFGVALAWVRSRTGSIFPGMVVHAGWNAVALLSAVNWFHAG